MRKEAFTLTELLVAIVILGILASIAIPAFSRWYPNYKLRSAATDLFSKMQFAKLQAVKENADCAVVFNDTVGYQVISGGPNKNYYDAGDNVILRTIGFHIYDTKGNIGYGHAAGADPFNEDRGFDNDITFNDITAGADTIVFNSRGTIHKQADSAGEVYLVNNKNTSYMVGVNAIGGIFLKKWDASSAAWE